MAELLRSYSGKSWYPKINLNNISMAKAVETYRKVGQPAFADTMKHQTEIQLGIEVAWGEGEIIDKNTIRVNGKIYKGKNLVIGTGSRPTMLDILGIDLPGVITYRDHPELRTDPKKW
jgi:pyruvate/2-oxoglutarate dehydrogenase complex dihydrolipoamide dehydrogenase (E3) component